MKSEWVFPEELEHLLAALTVPNRLACKVSLATGLRIGDVLMLRTEQVRKHRFTVQEAKTGKRRNVSLSVALVEEVLRQAGAVYAFPGRLDGRKPRTRQAVWKDLKRVCRVFRLNEHLSPHSMRKVYAVEEYHHSDLKRVQRLLQHDSEAVTMLYAYADELTARRLGRRKARR